MDETYVRVKGKWTYLYRAVDSAGATIDFLLTARRDAAAAMRFFQKALAAPGHPSPRVINVDGNPCCEATPSRTAAVQINIGRSAPGRKIWMPRPSVL